MGKTSKDDRKNTFKQEFCIRKKVAFKNGEIKYSQLKTETVCTRTLDLHFKKNLNNLTHTLIPRKRGTN